ncbi:MAG: LruC domain-containing protein [Bacteroidales bacterium]
MKNILLLLLLVLLGSCVKEPASGPKTPDGLMEVPAGFDWKMTDDKAISLAVLDAEPATVRVFTASQKSLIASGSASVGLPFVTTLNLPHTQTTLFVQKIAANGSVVEQTITVEQAAGFLFPAVSPLRNTAGALRAARVLPTFDKIINPGDNGSLVAPWQPVIGQVAYPNVKVTDGYNGSLTFHWTAGQSSTVYIEGNVTITGMSSQEKPGNKIIVLDGATLTITMDPFTSIDVEVDEGGTLRTTRRWSLNALITNNGSIITDGVLTFTSYTDHTAHLINNGSFHAKVNAQVSNAATIFNNTGEAQFDGNLLFDSNAIGSNSGTLTVNNTFSVTNFSEFDNSGHIEADAVNITANGTLTNACSITAGTLTSGNQGCTLHITNGAITTVGALTTTGGLTLLMDQGAIFKTTTVNVYQLAVSTPTGGTGRSLFLYENGSYIHTSSFTGPVEVVSPNYETEQASYYNLTFSGGAAAVTEQTYSIPQTSCNGGAGLIGGGVDPNEPNSYLPSIDGYNTLAFEDMWPLEGDYDMNDLVVTFNVAFFENASTVSRMIIKGNVLAVGAGTPTHGLALQLDQTSAANVTSVTRSVSLEEGVFSLNSVNGTEAGVQTAVVPLFASVSDVIAITYQRNNFINTDPVSGSRATPIEWVVDIRFAEPVAKEDLTLNNGLNFFMVTGGDREKEVHLFGFEPTSKANTALFGTGDDDSVNGATYSTQYGYPWGLIIPGSFRYPIEKTPLNQAFLQFDNWISSGKVSNPDWYIPEGGNVNPAKLFPVAP